MSSFKEGDIVIINPNILRYSASYYKYTGVVQVEVSLICRVKFSNDAEGYYFNHELILYSPLVGALYGIS